MKLFWMAGLTLLLTGCQFFADDESDIQEAAHDWAEAYFNNDFHAAERLVTPESIRWLQYAASNTTQQELDALPDGGATVAVPEYNLSNDTVASATVVVSNYVRPTAIGRQPTVADKGMFLIPLVKRNGKWLVRMEALPRSEKQSHD